MQTVKIQILIVIIFMFFIGFSSYIIPYVFVFWLLCAFLFTDKTVHIQLFKRVLCMHNTFLQNKQTAYKQINKVGVYLKDYLKKNNQNIQEKCLFSKENNDYSLKHLSPDNKLLELTLVNSIANNPPPCSFN